ncbi:MAG: hypothetical protein RL701_6887 [Pseudomonadota bacterium]|jgi:hypothetical protein
MTLTAAAPSATPSSGLLRRAVFAIGVLTVVTGAVQVFVPGWVLGVIGSPGDPGATARTSFAIVGMFMVLFGGLLLHVLANEHTRKSGEIALFWCAAQKLAASIAVTLGVWSGVFGPLALTVALLDFVSAVLFYVYRARAKALV